MGRALRNPSLDWQRLFSQSYRPRAKTHLELIKRKDDH
jgi:hypothetical protein